MPTGRLKEEIVEACSVCGRDYRKLKHYQKYCSNFCWKRSRWKKKGDSCGKKA